MYGRSQTKAGGKVGTKGLFADGIWQCNCEPRLPAERFQTRNGGQNHGRWFYTCQLPKHKSCNFFLWDDDAKPREEAAILNNSRTEPTTPQKNPSTLLNAEPITPITPYTPLQRAGNTPSQRGASSTFSTLSILDPDEEYDWPDTDEEKLLQRTVDQVSMPPPETPRKATKTDSHSSPAKRKLDSTSTPDSNRDLFMTPSTGMRGRDLFSAVSLLSPAETPTPARFKDVLKEPEGSLSESPVIPKPPVFRADNLGMAPEILEELRDLNIELTQEAIDVIKETCRRQALKMQGIEKGRDISRAALQTKDIRITQLQANIDALEADRETTKAVIRHLRREAAENGRKA